MKIEHRTILVIKVNIISNAALKKEHVRRIYCRDFRYSITTNSPMELFTLRINKPPEYPCNIDALSPKRVVRMNR